MRSAILVALFVTTPVLADDRGKEIPLPRDVGIPGVREIPISGLRIAFPADPGGAANPEIITSAEQLAMSRELKEAAEVLKTLVNFETEKLVLIAWVGSFSDQFTIEGTTSDKRITVTFRVQPGSALDYSQRIRLFAIPKDMGVRTGAK